MERTETGGRGQNGEQRRAWLKDALGWGEVGGWGTSGQRWRLASCLLPLHPVASETPPGYVKIHGTVVMPILANLFSVIFIPIST